MPKLISFYDLKPEIHAGKRAKIHDYYGIREGVLSWVRSKHPDRTHWGLSVPNERFGTVCVSYEHRPSHACIEILDDAPES